jgi:hypothetical protein
VDCRDLEKLAQEGAQSERRASPEVQVHLDACEGCRALYAGQGELGQSLAADPVPFELSDLEQQLAQAIAQEDATLTGRLRALSTPKRARLIVAVGLALSVMTFLVWQRPDYHLYQSSRMALVLSCFVALAILASWEALRPLSVAPSPTWRRVLLVLGAVMPFALALMPEAPAVHAANTGGSVFSHAAVCLSIGLGAATPVITLWAWLDRGGISEWAMRGLVAAMGGLYANAMLQLHCPVTQRLHLLLGHAGVTLVLLVALTLLPRLSRAAKR